MLQRKCLAEVFATFTLIFIGTGAVAANEASGEVVTHVGISLVFGIVVMAMIYSVGEVSGAHINPAVTIGFWAARRFPGKEVAPYILSQCIGALLGSSLVRVIFYKNETLGATRPLDGVWQQSFGLELALTWVLMWVILCITTGAKEKGLMAGVAIGGVIAMEALFGGPISGASMNPARSLAPAILEGDLSHQWLYIVAPILGAVLAVPACWCCTFKPETDVESAAD